MATLQNVQKIQIELDGNPPFEYIIVKQGESGSRVAEITLLENKKEFSIPSGTTAKIKFYKPDGKPVLNPAEISGNVIKVTYTEQMLAAPGTGRGEIALYNGNNILRTATYYTKIVPTVYKENGLISDSELLDLSESIIKINATASAENATTAANNAATAATEAKNAATTATANAQAATSTANTKAAAASTAAEAANKAAAACNEIAKGINSMTDETTGKIYSIGINGGKVYLEPIE